MYLKTVGMVMDSRKNPVTPAPITMCPSWGPSSPKTMEGERRFHDKEKAEDVFPVAAKGVSSAKVNGG